MIKSSRRCAISLPLVIYHVSDSLALALVLASVRVVEISWSKRSRPFTIVYSPLRNCYAPALSLPKEPS